MIGASGGIGHALLQALQHSPAFSQVVGIGRSTLPALDLLDESSIQSAAADIAARRAPLRLLIDVTGFLHDSQVKPERSWRDLNSAQMSQAFPINAVGPALLMKHFLPILPREGKSVFASLSAKVGSIGDNRLGGLVQLSRLESCPQPIRENRRTGVTSSKSCCALRRIAPGHG